MPEILIHYGSDAVAMVTALMQAADVAAHIKPAARVCIKPNLVVARPAEEGATTHPAVVEGIIVYLQQAGLRDITIAEGSWVGDSTRRAFSACGYEALAKQYGVRLVDTKRDGVVRRQTKDGEFLLCESVAGCDYLINVPVLKGHCQTGMTCCLKNLKGCIPDAEKRRYHTAGLHRPIARLNTLLRPDLHIVDGLCGDINFEEGGNPLQANRILLGFDAVLLDSYCAGLMGYHPDEIGHLRLAREYGVGEYCGQDLRLRELGTENRPKALPAQNGAVRRLAEYIEEDGACSACYAALVFALQKSGRKPAEKVKIGQGFRGRRGGGLGVGNCAAGCAKHIAGCPPSALDIVGFLHEEG